MIMKRLLVFSALFLFGLVARGANPAYEDFRGTNGTVVVSNATTKKIVIGPRVPEAWTNQGALFRLSDAPAAVGYIGWNDTNVFITRNIGGSFIEEERNLGIGYQTANNWTSGDRNTMFGNGTGRQGATGDLNTGIGWNAMRWSVDGANNTAIGARAMEFNTNGNQNTATGLEAMQDIGNGTDNCAYGYDALDNAIGVFACAAYGSESFHNHLSGDYVTGFGYRSGVLSESRAFNTFIGAQADLATFNANFTNASALGFDARVTANNQVRLGNGSAVEVFTSGGLRATLGMPTNAASFNFVTTNLLSGQAYTNFAQRGHVVATIAMTNILAGDVSAMSLIVDQNADGTWDTTNGPVRINGVALSAGEEQLFGLLQPGARFAFTNQSAGTSPGVSIRAGSCQWSRW